MSNNNNKKKKTMNDLINRLGIDETFTKPVKKEKVFTKFSDIAVPAKGYNYVCDLLYLPEDSKTHCKFALVCMDCGNNMFDLQEIRNRDSETVLNALKAIFKRGILKKPSKGSQIQTDSGTEYGDVFHKYLYNEDIYHKIAGVGRHNQMSAVEAVNKQLGRLFNGYMNSKEADTGKVYRDWCDIIPTIRDELNEIREKPTKNPFTYIPKLPDFSNVDKNEFYEGQMVYYKLDEPRNMLNEKQSGKFRVGDRKWSTQPKKIVKVFLYPSRVPFRYMLEGIPNISFTTAQLKKSTQKEELFYPEKFRDKRTVKKQIQYLVQWKHHKVDQSTWENESQLKEDLGTDAFNEFVEDYKDSLKKPNKVTKK